MSYITYKTNKGSIITNEELNNFRLNKSIYYISMLVTLLSKLEKIDKSYKITEELIDKYLDLNELYNLFKELNSNKSKYNLRAENLNEFKKYLKSVYIDYDNLIRPLSESNKMQHGNNTQYQKEAIEWLVKNY
jgi:Glu-tRNA(Gln) amidotransferase subunit E-like FAD-binding protein